MGKGRSVLQPDGIENSRVYVGLLHYPVYDKSGRLVCTAVTNLDIHDLARCAMTFGVEMAYIINPLESQRELVKRIMQHWTHGAGARYNPIRGKALRRIQVERTLEEVIQEISEANHQAVRTIATDAAWHEKAISYNHMRHLLHGRSDPYLVVFGTGWGMAREILEGSDYVLPPIEGRCGYNHLSVRSAIAIILDRLMGTDREEETENGFHGTDRKGANPNRHTRLQGRRHGSGSCEDRRRRERENSGL